MLTTIKPGRLGGGLWITLGGNAGKDTTMGKEILSGWHNYKTGETDFISGAPEDLNDYIPQDGPSQNMYNLLREKMGKTEIEAAIEVLIRHIPQEKRAP